jgi:hypothetical protein
LISNISAPRCRATCLGPVEQCGADSLSTQRRHDVQLVEQRHLTLIPDIGTQGQQRYRDGWLTSEHGDYRAVGEQPPEPAGEDGRPRRRRVVLAIEGIEHLGDHTGLGHSCFTQRADVVRAHVASVGAGPADRQARPGIR